MLDLFDCVVGENGALLYDPVTGLTRLLTDPPPPEFADILRRRGVPDMSVGAVIVAI